MLGRVDGTSVPIPINLDTVNRLYGLSPRAVELSGLLAERAEPVKTVRTSEDVVVSQLGRDPSELDASVAARIPVRHDRDDRYFTDRFQGMPLRG